MKMVQVEDRGPVAILRLNNGVTNAINPALLEDLSGVVPGIAREYRGLVLAGGEKFFCMGFDLPALIQFGRGEMADFFHRFNEIVLNLFTLSFPTCCALCGHATAGGAILALAGDYRFGAEGKKLIGLNEIKLGVPAPYLADLILRQLVGDRNATEMINGGEFLTMSEAARIGLVDDVLPLQDVEPWAVEKLTRLASLPAAAFSANKANRIEAIKTRYEANHRARGEAFLECWFSEPVQALLVEASLKFSKG